MVKKLTEAWRRTKMKRLVHKETTTIWHKTENRTRLKYRGKQVRKIRVITEAGQVEHITGEQNTEN